MEPQTATHTDNLSLLTIPPSSILSSSSYFLSTEQGSTQRHLYRCGSTRSVSPAPALFKLLSASKFFFPSSLFSLRVSTVDASQKECLSCSLFRSKCNYFDSLLSPSLQHLLLNCRGLLPPLSFIFFFRSCGVMNAAVISPSLKILIRRPSLQ